MSDLTKYDLIELLVTLILALILVRLLIYMLSIATWS